jgi:hypothetical protein
MLGVSQLCDISHKIQGLWISSVSLWITAHKDGGSGPPLSRGHAVGYQPIYFPNDKEHHPGHRGQYLF